MEIVLSSPLQVMHVITKLELGGAQQNTLYTVSHLSSSLFESHLVCGEGGLLDSEALALANVSVHFIPSLVREIHLLSDWNAYNALKELFACEKPDIVHTHSSKAGILGREAAFETGVPMIVHTYHGYGFHRFQNPLLFRIYLETERRACRRTHHLIFVSNENLNWAKELGLIQNASISLIRSGISIAPLLNARRDDSLRSTLGIPANAKLVAMIACLKPQKDPLTYLEAADLVLQRMPEVYFLLIGDGELRSRVTERISKMKYRDHFILLGWRRDVPSLLANIDLIVVTSLWEGLPRVIPEATVAAVPVIASNIEGIREVILEGKNGSLAQAQNPRDFAEKIASALRDQWKVDSAYAERISREFDIDQMVRKQEQLYLSLVSTEAV